MKKNNKHRILLFIGLVFLGVFGLMVTFIRHYDIDLLPKYQLRYSKLQPMLKNALSYQNGSLDDYDIVYMPKTDTIWDKESYGYVIDTFNIRFVTHGHKQSPYRDQNFTKWAKGCCTIGSHRLYIYDDETLTTLFLPTKQVIPVMIDKSGITNYSMEEEFVGFITDSTFRIIEIDNEKHGYRNAIDYFLSERNHEIKTDLYLHNEIFINDMIK